ncbi:hypothetical protein AMAG_11057 [Allomyces macrogynus ATCC 38327]|uniref:G-patch domain-containing protein n=1 Tax=Allomyces macrogynus (strain ATCC 38327) TaxID=578462 RepID=A0A0L0SS96_ALLM3|nr:hypothetical protein AMAG_11057 [Allomyces macrogynus ATCC 38327]|eukprot:KNE65428.1 hypothetical protein AMAG_11057 [Allomyces macrogynus ATCC 38327]
MGLAGPRVRQRISADPQNRAWAEDTSKFGFRMLEKMGWSSGKGLGADESGTTSHVKVSLKSDASGIGAKAKNSDNWLSNTDAFSRLLADLNARVEEEGDGAEEDEVAASDASSSGSRKKKAKKEKKAAKKEKKEKKKSKKAKKSSDSDDNDDGASSSRAVTPTPTDSAPDAAAVAAVTHAREKRKQTLTPTVDDVLAPRDEGNEIEMIGPDMSSLMAMFVQGSTIGPSTAEVEKDEAAEPLVPTPAPSDDADSAGEGKKERKSKSKDKKSKKDKKDKAAKKDKKRSRDADDAEADGEGASKKKRKSRD